MTAREIRRRRWLEQGRKIFGKIHDVDCRYDSPRRSDRIRTFDVKNCETCRWLAKEPK